MSVVFDEAALQGLFTSEPVRQKVTEVALEVEARVEQKLTSGPDPLFHRNPGIVPGLIQAEVQQDGGGVFALVGVVDHGRRLAEYLKSKEAREGKWFQTVLHEMRI